MKHQLENAMTYVEDMLRQSGGDAGRRHPFRSRSKHTRRVLKWAERISEGRDDVNLHVLYMAVIFHDIGYVKHDLENHQVLSAKLFREYAKEHDFDHVFTDEVVSCIEIHSDKHLLKKPERLTLEQILLMEADLLDEEGALAICWDGMACGFEGNNSYEDCLERTKREVKGKLENNPMVTKKASELWDQKQKFVKQYIKDLEHDLKEWA